MVVVLPLPAACQEQQAGALAKEHFQFHADQFLEIQFTQR